MRSFMFLPFLFLFTSPSQAYNCDPQIESAVASVFKALHPSDSFVSVHVSKAGPMQGMFWFYKATVISEINCPACTAPKPGVQQSAVEYRITVENSSGCNVYSFRMCSGAPGGVNCVND